MLVSMIDIFTVLVTFLLMTAVFSRTVILELKLPPANAQGCAAGGRPQLRTAGGISEQGRRV
jgi:biopolymer transport protein ExbD